LHPLHPSIKAAIPARRIVKLLVMIKDWVKKRPVSTLEIGGWRAKPMTMDPRRCLYSPQTGMGICEPEIEKLRCRQSITQAQLP
jgi:hypothetical protein